MREIYTVANGEYQRYLDHFTHRSDTPVMIHYHIRGVPCVDRCTPINVGDDS